MTASPQSVQSLLQEFYRCPQLHADFSLQPESATAAGYFRINHDLICYGRLFGGQAAETVNSALPEVGPRIIEEEETICLPFDPSEVIANLRLEKYMAEGGADRKAVGNLVRQIYYLLRPLLPVKVRKHLQRLSLRGWDKLPFPHWPVDRSADRVHEWLLGLAIEAGGTNEVPFVWFWPEGHSSCATITHDVETSAGRDFCSQLMDLDDSYQIKSSFQVVPEERYDVPTAFLESIRTRGFELNIHDLNHDGHLFSTPEQFLERVKKINQYGKQFKARGFRSAVLYRQMEWMKELEFAYDMSVPNVAHLDPQRGGCCTVMPFFVGRLIEIPVTATQDYSLFHILGDYSTKLWQKQVATISRAHGLSSFIVHPDYVIERRARHTYEQLLSYLAGLRTDHNLWIACPGEVSDWWRARSEMRLVRVGDAWRVEGKGSERARVAYATVEGKTIVYRIEPLSRTADNRDLGAHASSI